MKTLHINVVNKVATYSRRDGDIVCGNSDYQILFNFDAEWDAHTEKTARFIWGGKHWDQPFTGNICPVPIIKNTESVSVGVYAGDLSTTTPVTILCERSILCDESEIYDANIEACREEAVEAAERAEAAAREAASYAETINLDNIKVEVTPVKGVDYFTEADKAEIAEMVDGATVVQAPKFVNSVAEMTDQSRVYVMASTGRIWAYMDATVEQEVTKRVDIIGTTDNPYEAGRLSSGGANSGDVTTHTLTPYIDLTKAEYQGKTIQIHLEGNRYASESNETYIMGAVFDTSKNTVVGRAYTDLSRSNLLGSFDNAGMTLEIRSVTNAVLTFPVPLVEDGGRTVGYFRFCGLGTTKDSVYITYPDTELVTGGQWVDTGTSYTPSVSTEDLNTVAEQAAAIVDNNLLSVIGTGEVSV